MFRISQYMQELQTPLADSRARKPPGPVVIWNLVRRCNLTCKHCYSISADIDFPGELSTAEVFEVMDDLRAFRVPVLILSGGEPLLRADIFEISRRAKDLGFYVGLSTNGTLIDENQYRPYRGGRLRLRRYQHRRYPRNPRPFPPEGGRLRRLHARHPPVPGRGYQGRHALYASPGTMPMSCRCCCRSWNRRGWTSSTCRT